MYDRSTMHRGASYTYPPIPASTAAAKSYSNTHHTSSAFSASANPNEDWTKISDLAERRRIQNRIAQRNYRKKLKKRLEDLERRAGSSSASPEQKHQELAETGLASAGQPSASSDQWQDSDASHVRRDLTPDVLPQQYILPTEDPGMFSQQSTRQLSTSPPPFSYGSFSTIDAPNYTTASSSVAYCGIDGSGMDLPLYPPYLSAMAPGYQPIVPSMTSPLIKEEYYNDDEMNPFSMSYASIAGVDVAATQQAYSDISAYTPPLSDSFDFSQPDSPPELAGCLTPVSMPRTPPMQAYEPLFFDETAFSRHC